jgi:hypothetical protein
MKSVPNLISYLHEFFWNFSQFLAIYFELFPSESKFNSEDADEWGPPVSRRFPRRARLSARHHHVAATHPRHSRAVRALWGPRAGVPTAASRQRCRRPPCHARRRPPLSTPDRACPTAPTPPSTPSVHR